MATFIYIRVSSKEQAADGSSLPNQVRTCTRFCDSEGMVLSPESNIDCRGVFADPGVSAWKVGLFSRPGFISLWKNIKRGDTIVMLDPSRGFRSTMDFLRSWDTFENSGVSMKFVHGGFDMTTAVGRMIGTIAAQFAQFKSDLISERVRESIAARKGIKKKSFQQKDRRKWAESEFANLNPQKKSDAPAGTVYGYARVSTGFQSYESQIPTITSIASSYADAGYRVHSEILVDSGISAFKTNWADRPSGAKLFSMLAPGDVIVTSKLDRAFRSTIDAGRTIAFLKDRGVILHCGSEISTANSQGEIVAKILSVMAEWESAELSWRTKEAKKFRGEVVGPWDHTPRWINIVGEHDKRFEIDPVYYTDIVSVFQMRDAGLTIRQISDEMESVIASRWCRRPLPVVACNPRTVVMSSRGYERTAMSAYVKYRNPAGLMQREFSESMVRNHLASKMFMRYRDRVPDEDVIAMDAVSIVTRDHEMRSEAVSSTPVRKSERWRLFAGSTGRRLAGQQL